MAFAMNPGMIRSAFQNATSPISSPQLGGFPGRGMSQIFGRGGYTPITAAGRYNAMPVAPNPAPSAGPGYSPLGALGRYTTMPVRPSPALNVAGNSIGAPAPAAVPAYQTPPIIQPPAQDTSSQYGATPRYNAFSNQMAQANMLRGF